MLTSTPRPKTTLFSSVPGGDGVRSTKDIVDGFESGSDELIGLFWSPTLPPSSGPRQSWTSTTFPHEPPQITARGRNPTPPRYCYLHRLGIMSAFAILSICALLPWTAPAMRADRLSLLRQETVDMFYHGYNNYMKHAFPEDEVGQHRRTLSSIGC